MSDIVDINGIPFGDLSKVNAIAKADFSFFNGIASAGGGASGSFTDTDFSLGIGSDRETFSDMSIGDAAGDRIVVIAWSAYDADAIVYASVGGAACTLHNSVIQGVTSAGIASVVVASGTIADVYLQFDTEVEDLSVGIYAIYGAQATIKDEDTDSGTSSSNIDLSINVGVGDVVIAAAAVSKVTSGQDITWDEVLSEDYNDEHAVLNNPAFSSAHNGFDSGNWPLDISATTVSDASAGAGGAFGPADSYWDDFEGDDFSGDNGDPFNPRNWEVGYADGSDPWEIQNNKLRITVAPSERNDLLSKFSLSGDFDVEFGYTLVTYPSTNEWQVTLLAAAYPYDVTYGARIRHSYYNGHRILHKAINGGGTYDLTQVSTSVTTAVLRMVRVDNNFTSYHGLTGTTLMKTSAVSGASGKNFQFIIRGYSSTSNPSAVFDINNFTINSGTVVAPY
jgi:hypothetical protein